jgi:hypothetical protein
MARIFLVFALAASSIGPNSCSPNAVDEVSLPAEVAAVSAPFIAAVKRGDTKRAEQRMAPSFVDDSRVQFTDMSAILNLWFQRSTFQSKRFLDRTKTKSALPMRRMMGKSGLARKFACIAPIKGPMKLSIGM